MGNQVVSAALAGDLGAFGDTLAADLGAEAAGLPPAFGASNAETASALAAAPIHRDARGAGGVPDEAQITALIGRSRGRPLPPAVVGRMGVALGHDLSGVSVHTDAAAQSAAVALQANAFAVGRHLFFRPGAFAPGTPKGDELIAHELVHVVQHDEGRLPQASGLAVSSPSDAAEREAEHTAAAAMSDLAGASAWDLGGPRCGPGRRRSRRGGGGRGGGDGGARPRDAQPVRRRHGVGRRQGRWIVDLRGPRGVPRAGGSPRAGHRGPGHRGAGGRPAGLSVHRDGGRRSVGDDRRADGGGPGLLCGDPGSVVRGPGLLPDVRRVDADPVGLHHRPDRQPHRVHHPRHAERRGIGDRGSDQPAGGGSAQGVPHPGGRRPGGLGRGHGPVRRRRRRGQGHRRLGVGRRVRPARHRRRRGQHRRCPDGAGPGVVQLDDVRGGPGAGRRTPAARQRAVPGQRASAC